MTADQILSYLHEVATELDPTGVQHVIVVVGGALLAVRGLRDSTMDIDSVRRIEPELQKPSIPWHIDTDSHLIGSTPPRAPSLRIPLKSPIVPPSKTTHVYSSSAPHSNKYLS